MKLVHLPPIEAVCDRESPDLQLKVLLPNGPEQADVIERIREEYRRYFSSKFAAIGVSLPPLHCEEFDPMKRSNELKQFIKAYALDLLEVLGIDANQGVLFSERTFPRDRFPQGPSSYDLRLEKIALHQRSLEEYLYRSYVPGQRHTVEDRPYVFMGLTSEEDYPVQQDCYSNMLATAPFVTTGPFDYGAFRAQASNGIPLPALLIGQYREGHLEHRRTAYSQSTQYSPSEEDVN